jgi:hypothetical protein
MNILSQQKQAKKVVEHKGSIDLGSDGLVLPRAQSLAWDTLFAEAPRISLADGYLQFSQWFAWDTLSQLRITDEIAGIFRTFYFAGAIRAVGHHSQDIRRIPQKILFRTVADPQSKKTLSRCGVLVAYRIEGLWESVSN